MVCEIHCTEGACTRCLLETELLRQRCFAWVVELPSMDPGGKATTDRLIAFVRAELSRVTNERDALKLQIAELEQGRDRLKALVDSLEADAEEARLP